jgi:hypothetical protein
VSPASMKSLWILCTKLSPSPSSAMTREAYSSSCDLSKWECRDKRGVAGKGPDRRVDGPVDNSYHQSGHCEHRALAAKRDMCRACIVLLKGKAVQQAGHHTGITRARSHLCHA